jgi:LacI family transcriptional regulator
VEHLAALGHERIGFVGGPEHLFIARRRKEAFRRSTEKRGQRTRTVESDFTVVGGYAGCAKLMSGFAPTAIVAANDLMAIGAIQYAHENGIAVPSKVSVVGFDDIFFAQCTYPALTTIAQDRRRIGEIAFQALWTLVSGEVTSGSEYKLETDLVIRDSTGPA